MTVLSRSKLRQRWDSITKKHRRCCAAILARAREIQREVEAARESTQNRIPLPEYCVNEYVLIMPPEGRVSNKLLPRWSGPYRIIRKHRRSYDVVDINNGREKKVDVGRIRRFECGELTEEQLKQIAAWDGQYYEIENIISHKRDPNDTAALLFEVKWKGYSDIFGVDSLTFLGLEADGETTRISQSHRITAEQYEIPRDKKALSRFLGFANYFRKYIPDYATLAAPLQASLKDPHWDAELMV